jgi:exodeoxyribonuclease VII small subunit
MSANDKTIEDQMNELRGLVAWFEEDDFKLEQAGDKFAEATKLAKQIEEDLTKLKNDITVLKKSFEEA